jgi:cupin fold WbuC family metalloprotein
MAILKPYQILTQDLLTELSGKARQTERKRLNYNIHELPDLVQRFFNAIEPESYVRPHRHLEPPKNECFIVLRGKFLLILFSNTGAIMDVILLEPDKHLGVDIQPGVWHTIMSLESGSVFFEVKDGPYIQSTDKDFAPWAPDEKSLEAQEYWNKLRTDALYKNQE